MSPLTPNTSASDSATLQRLEGALRAQALLLNIVMFLLILVTGSLCLFMLREQKILRKQLEQGDQYLAAYRKNVEPKIADLQARLQGFAKLYPDFEPIVARYFGSNAPPIFDTNAPPPVSSGSRIPAPPPQ